MVHKSFKRAFKSVTKVFKSVRIFKFLQNINPWVALGIFAVGWLFNRSSKPDTPDYGTTDFDTTEKIYGNHDLFNEEEHQGMAAKIEQYRETPIKLLK